jgi:hypothetical protein
MHTTAIRFSDGRLGSVTDDGLTMGSRHYTPEDCRNMYYAFRRFVWGMGVADPKPAATAAATGVTVRVTREIEIKGDSGWVDRCLENSLVQPDRPFVTGRGTITELSQSREIISDRRADGTLAIAR